jgi:hypothetical protein
LHVPHASFEIPAAIREQFIIDDVELSIMNKLDDRSLYKLANGTVTFTRCSGDYFASLTPGGIYGKVC